ncbi:hypothetical protein Tco_0480444 [Tanacetum coccineum]
MTRSSCGSLPNLKTMGSLRVGDDGSGGDVTSMTVSARVPRDKREVGDGGVEVTSSSSKGSVSSLDGKAGSSIASVEAAKAGIPSSSSSEGSSLGSSSGSAS